MNDGRALDMKGYTDVKLDDVVSGDVGMKMLVLFLFLRRGEGGG